MFGNKDLCQDVKSLLECYNNIMRVWQNKRLWVLAGLLVLCGLAMVFYHFRVIAPEKQKKARVLYQEALKFEEKGDLGRAAKRLQEALEVLPSFEKASSELKKIKKKITEKQKRAKRGISSSGSSNYIGEDKSGQQPATPTGGFNKPEDLIALFPTHYSGYERSEAVTNELGAFCNYQPIIESDAQSIEAAIWLQKDTSEAAGFIGRVSKVLYPNNKKEFLFKEKYPAYFGTGSLDQAIYVWVAGRLVFELHAKGVKGKPAELWDELNGLAMRFKL